jgi:hypothetical protein
MNGELDNEGHEIESLPEGGDFDDGAPDRSEARARAVAAAAAAVAANEDSSSELPPLGPLLLLPLLLAAVVYFGGSVEISERYRLDLNRIRCNAPPPGPAAAYARRDLQRMPLQELERSLFDRNLGFAVRQVFEENPWVRRVRSVKRVFPRGLEVDLEYRRPYAAVRRGDRFLFADAHGELLPVNASRRVLKGPMLTFRGAGGKEPAQLDELWFADAVREGVSVLRELGAHRRHEVWEKVGIVAIDVGNYEGRLDAKKSEVLLVTDRNWSDPKRNIIGRPVYVRWGRSRKHPLGRAQLPVETKLDNLLGALIQRPGLQGVSIVDVRWKTPFYRPIEDHEQKPEIARGD